MDIKSVPYPFTFEIINSFHMNWRAWSVIHHTSFSDSLFPIAPKKFIVPIFFVGNICHVMHYCGAGVSSLKYKDWNDGGVCSYVIFWLVTIVWVFLGDEVGDYLLVNPCFSHQLL